MNTLTVIANGQPQFEVGQIVLDNMGAKWIVMGYVLGMVRVRPEPDGETVEKLKETIARLNAEAYSLHAALDAAQTRANDAERIIDCVSTVAADIYARESTTSPHGCRVRADLNDPLLMIDDYTRKYMRKDN